MLIDRLKKLFFVAAVTCVAWHGQCKSEDPTYLNLSDNPAAAQGLQSTPLLVSRYPTSLCVAVDSSMSYLRTIDIDGNVWQWNTRPPIQRKQVASIGCRPICACISDDASLLAFGESDGSFSLMNLDSAETVFKERSSTSRAIALQIAHDGSQLACLNADGLVQILGTTGSVSHRFQVETSAIGTLAFSRDDSTLAVGTHSTTVALFDLDSDKGLAAEIDTQSRITALAFHPTDHSIVVACSDGSAFVHDRSKLTDSVALATYPFATWSLRFDTKGRRLVAGSWDGASRIFDTRSWRVSQKLKGHEESVCASIIGEKGMVSAGLDGRLLYWPAQVPGIRPKGLIAGPAEPVWIAAHSPDGSKLFLGGRGKRSEIWDLSSKNMICVGPEHPTVRCAAFSPDGQTIVTGGDDNTIHLASASDGKILYTLSGHRGPVSALVFIDDGKTLVSGCDRGLLKFWDVATGEATATRKRHTQQLYCAAVSPDGRWLITGGGHWAKGDPGELIIWDVEKRQFVKRLEGHTLTVWSIVFTNDGSQFASSDSAGDVNIWDTRSMELERTLKHETWLRPMAMSPDGTTLAVGRGDGSIRLWDTATWTQKAACNGHDSFTFWLDYAPDGHTLVSASNDGTVRFWETK